MFAKEKDVGLSPAHDQKFFVQVFFRLGETFFRKFLNVSKGAPFIFFYFAEGCIFKNSQRPPFYIFRHYATYQRPKKFEKKSKKIQKNQNFSKFFPHAGTVEEENIRHIEVLLLFLSLRYGADLGRSRLVILVITA